MKAYRIVSLLMSIFWASLNTKAQDSISYEGKKYKVHQEPTISYVIKFSDTIRRFADTKTYIVTSSDTIGIILDTYAPPLFPGGGQGIYEYISTNLKYPSTARKDNLQGIVLVSFIVNTQGRTDNISVVKSVRKDLDQAAMEVIQHMPAWQPATRDNKPVDVRLKLSVEFKQE